MDTNSLAAHHEEFGDALAPGETLLLGQYEILRFLNSGGFGITYLAKDSLNRTVVIKECFPESVCCRVDNAVRVRSRSHTDDFRAILELFINEAHALSRIEHPNVVGVHQVFEDNATAYMALDLVQGKDLLDWIEEGKSTFSPAELYEISIKLLDAIGHIHAQDLLHRDVSPDNILIDQNGHPVLIDFGAAREEASRKSRALSSVFVVKDGYSPPEFYVKGSQQGPSSDLYALAATLSHVITGEAPPDSQARLAALAARQPDPHQPLAGRFPQFTESFLAAIDKAMEVLPANRLQSAEEWLLMIDQSKRSQHALAKAQSDTAIDAKVTRLVEWSKREAQNDVAQDGNTKEPASAKHAGTRNSTADNGQKCSKKPEHRVAEIIDLRPLTAIDARLPSEGSAPSEFKEARASLAVPTPYERVRAAAAKQAIERSCVSTDTTPQPKDPRYIVRLSSIPVAFCAYLFYGQFAFQQEAVHAVTIQPLVMIAASISEELPSLGTRSGTERPKVLVNRGLQG